MTKRTGEDDDDGVENRALVPAPVSAPESCRLEGEQIQGQSGRLDENGFIILYCIVFTGTQCDDDDLSAF